MKTAPVRAFAYAGVGRPWTRPVPYRKGKSHRDNVSPAHCPCGGIGLAQGLPLLDMLLHGTIQAPPGYNTGSTKVQYRPRQSFWLQAKDLSLVSERPFACKRKAFRLQAKTLTPVEMGKKT